MDSHTPTETQRTISTLIGQLFTQKNKDSTLALIGKNLKPNNEESLKQWLTTDQTAFNEQTLETLLDLLNHCKTIEKSPISPQEMIFKAARFLTSVLLDYPVILRKRLTSDFNDLLMKMAEGRGAPLQDHVKKIGLILVKIKPEDLPRITLDLFTKLCRVPSNDEPMNTLHRYCSIMKELKLNLEYKSTIDWIFQHTEEHALNEFKLSSKKNAIDSLLPTIIVLLMHQPVDELSEFYRIADQEDIPLATKIMRLAEYTPDTEKIIANDYLPVDPQRRKNAILMITRALCFRTRKNVDLSRLFNHFNATNIYPTEIIITFNDINQKLLTGNYYSVEYVMKETIQKVFSVFLDDVNNLFSDLSPQDFHQLFQWHIDNSDLEEKKLHLASAFIQNLLQESEGSIVLTLIHSKITKYIGTHFGKVIETRTEWFDPHCQETLYQQAKKQALNTMKTDGYEEDVLIDLEMQISHVIENTKELALFLQHMSQIFFETNQKTADDLIDQAAETYMQQRIFCLNTKTARRCKSFYDENPELRSSQKLPKMGEIAFERTRKYLKSKYHNLYTEIAQLKTLLDDTEVNQSNHRSMSSCSSSSWASLQKTTESRDNTEPSPTRK